jgi:hypothetical protein
MCASSVWYRPLEGVGFGGVYAKWLETACTTMRATLTRDMMKRAIVGENWSKERVEPKRPRRYLYQRHRVSLTTMKKKQDPCYICIPIHCPIQDSKYISFRFLLILEWTFLPLSLTGFSGGSLEVSTLHVVSSDSLAGSAATKVNDGSGKAV